MSAFTKSVVVLCLCLLMTTPATLNANQWVGSMKQGSFAYGQTNSVRGVSATITTPPVSKVPSSGEYWSYWIGLYLQNGSFIQVGIALSPSNVNPPCIRGIVEFWATDRTNFLPRCITPIALPSSHALSIDWNGVGYQIIADGSIIVTFSGGNGGFAHDATWTAEDWAFNGASFTIFAAQFSYPKLDLGSGFVGALYTQSAGTLWSNGLDANPIGGQISCTGQYVYVGGNMPSQPSLLSGYCGNDPSITQSTTTASSSFTSYTTINSITVVTLTADNSSTAVIPVPIGDPTPSPPPPCPQGDICGPVPPPQCNGFQWGLTCYQPDFFLAIAILPLSALIFLRMRRMKGRPR